MGRVAQRLVVVDPFGAAQVHVPLVDAGAGNNRRELLEDFADLLALDAALFARHRHEHRLRAEFFRASNRHRRLHAILSRLPWGGADDTATPATSTDDQELRLSRAFWIHQSRDRREERVGVGK